MHTIDCDTDKVLKFITEVVKSKFTISFVVNFMRKNILKTATKSYELSCFFKLCLYIVLQPM